MTAPEIPADATVQQCVAAWFDLLDATEQLLLAGLRCQIGPNGDLEAAYRAWQRERNKEHFQMLVRMRQRLHDQEVRGG